jgi:hypothetical protein
MKTLAALLSIAITFAASAAVQVPAEGKIVGY